MSSYASYVLFAFEERSSSKNLQPRTKWMSSAIKSTLWHSDVHVYFRKTWVSFDLSVLLYKMDMIVHSSMSFWGFNDLPWQSAQQLLFFLCLHKKPVFAFKDIRGFVCCTHRLFSSPLMKGSLLSKDWLSFCVPVELVVSHNLFSEHWHNLSPCHDSQLWSILFYKNMCNAPHEGSGIILGWGGGQGEIL